MQNFHLNHRPPSLRQTQAEQSPLGQQKAVKSTLHYPLAPTMSSSTPSHSPPQPIPLISLPPSHSGSTTDGGCSLSHLEQIADLKQMSSRIGEIPTVVRGRATNQTPEGKHKTGCASHVKLVASRHWSKLGFRRRLLRLFKRESNGKKAVVNCAATLASADPMQHIAAVLPEVKVTPVALDPLPSTLSDGADSLAMPSAQVDTLPVSNSAIDEWLHSSPSAIGPLRLNIFPENVAAPVLATELPKPHARIEKTSQLVYCFSLLYRVPSSSPADVASDGSQATPLSESQREWVQTTESFEKNRVRWLVDQLVKSFAEDQLKGSAAAAEIVLLGPILDRETYRSLLSCFITKFEQTTPLDITVLQGLVQLVECASSGYLVDNDLVRIATVLFKELEVTHNGASDHPLHLTLALSRIFDVMVAGKVKDLNRERDHQPMLQLLDGLKGSDNKCLKYQAVYAHQALQYAPDDETPLQVLMRYAKVAAAAASTVSSVFKLDPAGLLEGR
ncbi:hypothetical protein BGX23_000774 [Mortierella sp. AD031]|nr:hypothetical protein BGX23_000774 [Mortierella sp. AD031]